MTQLPVCDFGEVIDPPTEDVTAHVVEALVACGVPALASRRCAAASRTCWREQRPDGSWWGRWGVNHIYGTGAVLPALRGRRRGHDRAPRATSGRLARRPPERRRGLGRADRELPRPGLDRARASPPPPRPRGRSLRCSRPSRDHPAVAGGVRYLAEHPAADGEWDEDAFTGTGFPGDFMIKYHSTATYFPRDRARTVPGMSDGHRPERGWRARSPARHDENFPVAFLLLPRDLRADMQAIYAFCRGDRRPRRRGIGGASPAARLAASTPVRGPTCAAAGTASRATRAWRRSAVTIHRHRTGSRAVRATRSRPTAWTSANRAGTPTATCSGTATTRRRRSAGWCSSVLGLPRRAEPHRPERRAPASGCSSSTSGRTSRRDLRRPRPHLPAPRGHGPVRRARRTICAAPSERPRAGAGGVRGRAGARAELLAGEPLWRLVPRRVATRPAHVQRRRARAVRRHRAPGIRHARPAPGAGAARARPHRRSTCSWGCSAGTAVTIEDGLRALPRDHARDGAQLLLRVRAAAPTRGARRSTPRTRSAGAPTTAVDDDEPLEAKLAAIAELRAGARRRATRRRLPRTTRVLVALADTVDRFAIPRAHLDALLDGVEMDLTTRRYGRLRGAQAVLRPGRRRSRTGEPARLRVHRPRGPATRGRPRRRAPDRQHHARRRRGRRTRPHLPAPGRDGGPRGDRGRCPRRTLERRHARRSCVPRPPARDEYFARGEQLLPLLDRRARACASRCSAGSTGRS